MAFYDNLKLEKGMYNSGNKSFTQVLEELDCSKNYEGTELEGLDAYQRQLKRFDIKVGGRSSDAVEKFFQTSDSAALFPEYVTRYGVCKFTTFYCGYHDYNPVHGLQNHYSISQ